MTTQRPARTSSITAASTLPEIAVVIAAALNKEGICAVLTGSAAAAIHTRTRNTAGVVDYITTSPVTPKRLEYAMKQLGFSPTPTGAFTHANASFEVRIERGVSDAGVEPDINTQTMQLRSGFVRVLSPTDTCHHQLLQWRAAPNDAVLASAVDLAARCDVDMPALRAWMKKQGILAAWNAFKKGMDATRLGEPPLGRPATPSARAATTPAARRETLPRPSRQTLQDRSASRR